jgi:anti-anti-sigma factor
MVTASGQLTIEHAAEMRDALLEALSTDGDMRIDMSGVEEADLTCVQLICSACKSARATGKNIYVKNPSRAVSARFGSGGGND